LGAVFGISLSLMVLGFLELFSPTHLLFPTARTRSIPLCVTFGDSITQYGFHPDLGGWVGLLAGAYERKMDIVCRGFSGYNTRWALHILEKAFSDLVPDVVTVFFGANDAALEDLSQQHVSLEEYKANLKKIVASLRQKFPEVRVLLIGPPPIHHDQREAYGRSVGYDEPVVQRKNEVTKLYAEACGEVAEEEGTAFLSLWHEMTRAARQEGEDVSTFLVDGLHLNEKGNMFVASKVSERLGHLGFDADKLPLHQDPFRNYFSTEQNA
jgi:lysophospholipase L1-like esterase